jgi:methionine-gamma-lyase
MTNEHLHPDTLAITAGHDPATSRGAIKPPLYLSSTFHLESADEGGRMFRAATKEGDAPAVYSRFSNPTVSVFEERLAAFDGSERALAFGSGMAAISSALLSLLEPGEHVVATAPIYGGTHRFLADVLPRFGIQTTFVPAGVDAAGSIREAAAAIKADRLRMIYVETPANPSNALVDIASVVHLADRLSHRRDRRVLTAVDNTLLGPVFQKPSELGADLVIYSATKFIGGHSDLIAGALTGTNEVIGHVAGMRSMLGSIASPFTAWLLARSFETIGVRMRRQAETATRLAAVLARHPSISRVRHLSLLDPKDASYEIYRRQCTGPGSLIAFEVKGGKKSAFSVLDRFEIVRLAVSLGGTESLVQHPASMTHSDVKPEQLAACGVTQGLIRLSVGLEDPIDLERDLLHALEAVRVDSDEEDARTTQIIVDR